MNISRPQLAAAVLLTIGGLLTGVAALALVVAGAVVGSGIVVVGPSDASVLADLEALLPFIVAFVVIDLATARGLLMGRTWASPAATLLALGIIALGVLGLLLLVLGNDPGAPGSATVDGVGIVGSFTAIYLSALIALRMTALPSGRALAAAA